MKVAVAEAVSMSGTPVADQAGRVATGEDGAQEEASASFLSAVASAINAQGDDGASDTSAEGEGTDVMAVETLNTELIALAIEGEMLGGEAAVDLLAEIANAQVAVGDSGSMPALSFGNPEVAALQAVMLNGQETLNTNGIALAESAASLTSAANGMATHPLLGLTSQQPTGDSSSGALSPQVSSPQVSSPQVSSPQVSTLLGLSSQLQAATVVTAASAANQPAPQTAGAAMAEAVVTLSQEALSAPPKQVAQSGVAEAATMTQAVAGRAAVIGEATTAKQAQVQAGAAQPTTAKEHTQHTETWTHTGGQDGEPGAGDQRSGVGTSGTAATTNTGLATAGPSFQATLANQSAGGRDFSATNLQGTSLQQAGFAKMPGLPEGAHMRVLSTNMANQTATVEVQHASLGPIQLEVELREQQLNLKAITNSMASALAIGASEHALRSTISEQGMDLGDMQVGVDRGDGQNPGNQDHWDQQKSKAQFLQERRGTLNRDDTVSFAEITQARIDTEA